MDRPQKIVDKENTIQQIDVFGNLPQARFGHTVTFLSRGQAILIGGAIGDTGKYSITGDTFSFDINTRWWRKVDTTGSSPSPRAAHSAVAVEKDQIVIYGGATGGGSLASDDLYLLDNLRNQEDIGIWTIIQIVGPTPGRRYGHTLTYSKPYLIVYGGNTGTEPINDCWSLNIEKAPFQWSQIENKGDAPIARVYHSASLCTHGTANGMVVIFGGRSGDSAALNDAWGLRRHRDGRWDWVKAPYKSDQQVPIGRYQHSSLFLGTLLMIIGGRTNNVGESLTLDVYDTQTSEWTKFTSIQRFRHGCWISQNMVYVYGGFELDSPNIPTDSISKVNIVKTFASSQNILKKCLSFIQTGTHQSTSGASTPEIRTNSPIGMNIEPSPNLLGTIGLNQTPPGIKTSPSPSPATTGGSSVAAPPKPGTVGKSSAVGGSDTGKQFQFLSHQFAQEGKMVGGTKGVPGPRDMKTSMMDGGRKLNDQHALHNLFLSNLLQPQNYINLPENAHFQFKSEHIIALCDSAEQVIRQQPIVLRVRAPLKIFGDIHGQYSDLMRFFDLWGSPYQNGKDGDIESYDYLFLGDYVDRGNHSLETICLLLALKVRYPDQIHLIRGNHEDKWINNGFGFSEECANRLGQDPTEEDSVFARVNRLFEWLPLATIIEDRILCIHGGIGSSVKLISDIMKLQRPIEVIHQVSTAEQQLVVDILWSDPTETDNDIGIQANIVRDPAGTGNIVKFGPDIVEDFLTQNNLSMIIRAHQCVMDGFERFAGGSLITVFSATDYCGRHQNAGAVLFLRQNLEIMPQLIYPNTVNSNNWIEDQENLKQRPPTPPRWKNPLARKSFD